MEFWIWAPLLFACGYWLGKWQNRHYRRDRQAWLMQKIKMLALRNELIAMRLRIYPDQPSTSRTTLPWEVHLARRRPSLRRWRKWLLGWLHRHFAWATRFNQFRPKTLVAWGQKQLRLVWHRKCEEGKRCGRPVTPDYVVDAIVAIGTENPGYSPRKIANMVKSQLEFAIDKKTVAKILKAHGFKPKPPGKRPPREQDPDWLPFLYNQVVCAMDFKTAIDIKGAQMFILNIIDHGRRKLILSRATYHPSSEWVAQQLREAFPFDEVPQYLVMDRDSIFLPIARKTLPAMGVEVRRIGYKCPWQNAVVERFNRTLKEELLDYVIPFSQRHMNRLLKEYQHFYNTARPHMTNGGFPPVLPVGKSANDEQFDANPGKLESISWLGGLHHSYRWAA